MSRFLYKVIFLIVLFLVVVPRFGKIEARCTDQKPDHAPNLFQIDTTETTAALYFTPINNAVSYYAVIYGLVKGDYLYGVSFNYGPYDGVISYTINELSPNTKYYFRVRAGNGCAVGKWSNTMSAETKINGKYTSPQGFEVPKIIISTPIPNQENTDIEDGDVAGVQTTPPPARSSPPSERSLLQKILDFLYSLL